MVIAVDGMGGDFAPYAVIEGVVEAIKEENINIIITGKKELIEVELKKHEYEKDKIRILDTREIVTTLESPVMAVRRKKDSSLVKALQLVKEGKADAVISAGSTGALMAGASLIIGRIKGIERVALAPMIPGKNRAFMIIDAGANVDCKPHYLMQFSLMAKVYFENILKIKEPSIGLINIGIEEEKGNELIKNTYKLLKNMDLNFVGNIEPRDAINGDVNILVCDGFIGNTILKTYEGVSLNLMYMLKEEIMKSPKGKLAAMFLKSAFKNVKNRLDYSEYGGTAFLGCKGVCVKAHGSSNGKAFKNAIKQSITCYNNKVIDKIESEIEKIYYKDSN